MKDGFYLSTYLHIDELAHLTGLKIRHDQNISLWEKRGENVNLVHYWELERVTGIKKHNLSFYNVSQAKDVINHLLKDYSLTIEDMAGIWGTPQLQTVNDYHSLQEYPTLSYHSIAHLFSAIMFNSEIFYNSNIIGLAVDGGPDNVVDINADQKNYYSGCVVRNGDIQLFPVYSPGFIWTYARKKYKLNEGTLMALATACESQAYLSHEAPLLIKDINGLRAAYDYIERLAAKIDSFTESDQRKLFNYFDPRFSVEDNKISMAMKHIQKMSLKVMETNLDWIIEQYRIIPEETYLALAGGYTLNCPTNSYLMEKYRFKGFVAPPCVSDTGISLGIALFAFYKYMKHFKFEMKHAYYGDKDDSLAELISSKTYKLFIKDVSTMNPVQAVKDLKEEPIIWFNGGAEVGPRALGNRSILADPRQVESKDKLNVYKQRQWWRPVAPIILEEDVQNWFENAYPTPFMLQTFKIKEDKVAALVAVSHMDSSARVQTVNKNSNALLYTLLKAFKEETGTPILCNTSLNDREEPIINRIEEAFNFALRKGIRVIYVNGQRVSLHNHDHYKLEKPLRRSIQIRIYQNETEKEQLLQKHNPHSLSNNILIFYCKRPELKRKFNIIDREDTRKLSMYAKVAMEKMGLSSMPGA